MKYVKLFYVGVLMSLAMACSSDDDNSTVNEDPDNSIEISNEPFSGTIGVSSFVVQSAIGQITFEAFVDGQFIENDGIEKLAFKISSSEITCINDFDSVGFTVSGVVETGQLGFQITEIKTSTPTGTAIQSGGPVELVSINGNEAVIKIRTVGNNYALEGKFTVTICPSNEIMETN